MPMKLSATFALWAILIAAVSASTTVTTPVNAQDAKPPENKVVATVDGGEIRESDVIFMAEDFVSELRRVPEGQRRNILLGALVDMKLMAQAAEKDGLTDSEAFKTRMAFLRLRALRDAYVAAKVAGAISDADVQARYKKDTADFEAAEEIKASHILVEKEETAKEIVKALDGGADFAELAKEKSTGPSGPNGGDLGFFTKGRMVKEFEEAAFALQAGSHTAVPIKTQFGWHVIKVEERRFQEPPAFDQVKDRIRESLMREKYLEAVEALKKNAKIEVVNGEAPKAE